MGFHVASIRVILYHELDLPEYKHTQLLFITITISCSSCALLVKSCGGGLE
jgi:hypothetical protein